MGQAHCNVAMIAPAASSHQTLEGPDVETGPISSDIVPHVVQKDTSSKTGVRQG